MKDELTTNDFTPPSSSRSAPALCMNIQTTYSVRHESCNKILRTTPPGARKASSSAPSTPPAIRRPKASEVVRIARSISAALLRSRRHCIQRVWSQENLSLFFFVLRPHTGTQTNSCAGMSASVSTLAEWMISGLDSTFGQRRTLSQPGKRWVTAPAYSAARFGYRDCCVVTDDMLTCLQSVCYAGGRLEGVKRSAEKNKTARESRC